MITVKKLKFFTYDFIKILCYTKVKITDADLIIDNALSFLAVLFFLLYCSFRADVNYDSMRVQFYINILD